MAANDNEAPIAHFGGVLATSLLIARAAEFMAEFAKSEDLAGIEHELAIILREALAIADFVRHQTGGPI